MDTSPGRLSSSGPIADARWADPDYICDRYPFEPGKIWIGRNPHCFEDAIGYADSRHVLVCASSGAGKGRSFIINNLAVWPGSTVSYDPKGELPQILAARRGAGDDLCEGMEQDVFVLDPLGKSGVGPEHLAYYDPISNLDPEDGELPTWAKRIARSVITIQEGSESGEWAKRAARLIALITMHVVTADYDETERNLITVLRLIMEGAADQVEYIRKVRPDIPRSELPDPTEILLLEMCDNGACRGWIASDARNLLRLAEKTPKFFESVRGEAADQLDWLKSQGIEQSITGHLGGKRVMDRSRQLDPKRLKTDPRGISVFVVMPQDDLDTYRPWVQTMFIGIFAAMRIVPAAPASGHQTLCVLDEFLSLGYQDYIANAMDNIRGAGMKLVIIVQNFGGLKKLYAEQIDSFYSNCGLELYFGKIGEAAGDYLLKQLGETEVVRTARNTSSSQTRQTQESSATAKGKTTGETDTQSIAQSLSSAETEGWSTTFSNTEGVSDSVSWSEGASLSHSKNWGATRGNSMGKNYGPHILFEGLKHSNNYGTSFNRSHGGGITRGGSKTRGGSQGTSASSTVGAGQTGSATRTSGETKTEGKSWQTGESLTETQTRGSSEGYQIGEGVAETFHKKPLLSLHEMNAYFRDFTFEDRDHPAYPGLALVRIAGENAFFVRRSNYDQDPYFEHCYSADPVHGYLALHEVPTLGYQFTQDHLFPIVPPRELGESGYRSRAKVRRFAWFKPGDELAEIHAKGRPDLLARAPFSGRVVDVVAPEDQEPGSPVLMLRTEKILSDEDRSMYGSMLFGGVLEDLRSEEAKRLKDEAAKQERLAREREARERAEAQRRRLEEEAQKRRDREERERAEAERKRLAEQERKRKEAAELKKLQEEARIGRWLDHNAKRLDLKECFEAREQEVIKTRRIATSTAAIVGGIIFLLVVLSGEFGLAIGSALFWAAIVFGAIAITRRKAVQKLDRKYQKLKNDIQIEYLRLLKNDGDPPDDVGLINIY